MAKKPTTEKWLIFVDTNVLLDFYRIGGESAKRQLEALERHKESIILNDQVHMEFLKNRQKVIFDSLKNIEKPKNQSFPPVIADRKAFKVYKDNITLAQEKYAALKKEIGQLLINPQIKDPVFQSINRIYESDCIFHVKRIHDVRLEVRELAKKRFMLGYPPRKQADTSIGDAVNWETIIHCAIKSTDNHNVLIVSRDGDYGTPHDNNVILNDWLRREFKERVSKKRKIELTKLLTDALRKLDETVDPEDEKEETRLLSVTNSNEFNNDTFVDEYSYENDEDEI